MLIHHSEHLFSKIRESNSLKDVKRWLDVTANDYWHYHYRFDEPAGYRVKNLGSSMINSIIINTVAPLLFAYGLYHREQSLKDKAIQWLVETEAEKNNIIKGWHATGISAKDASQSQALLELKTQYCDEKRCLDCAVGNALLKQSG